MKNNQEEKLKYKTREIIEKDFLEVAILYKKLREV